MFKYRWSLKNGYPNRKKNVKVFSTFACGGGSTMGYKLNGFDVIGANDIDPQMAKVYKKNHNPKNFFLCSIKELINKKFNKNFYNLAILDGSPPCSSFSLAGQREEKWQVEKKFREGQAKQVLDDLFFDFINLANKLKPKIVVAENVKGMLIGNAKGYTIEIKKRFNKIGYNVQLFLLNSAFMGVPQKRERVFFIAKRKDLDLPKLKLNFSQKPICFKEISEYVETFKPLTKLEKQYWLKAKQGEPVGKFKSRKKIHYNKSLNTITATQKHYHPLQPRQLTDKEVILGSSFPLDYNFLDIKPVYLCGMSVPPIMMANIAYEIYLQWLKKLTN